MTSNMIKKPNNSNVEIYGKHSVIAALQNKNRNHIKLIGTPKTLNSIQNLIPKNIKVETKNDSELNRLTKNSSHQGLILHTSTIFMNNIESIKAILQRDISCLMILDQVTDPQNVGAIIRSSLAFEIDGVIMTQNNSPHETPTINKTSSGAIEKLPIVKVTNLVSTLNTLKENGYWIVGLDSNTSSYINASNVFSKKTAIVMGSEGKGLRLLTKKHCDSIVKLPMSDQIDSLNVSNAAAITMYEHYKAKNT